MPLLLSFVYLLTRTGWVGALELAAFAVLAFLVALQVLLQFNASGRSSQIWPLAGSEHTHGA